MSRNLPYSTFLRAWPLRCLLLLAGLPAAAQDPSPAGRAAQAANDTLRINALIDAGKHYLYKPGEHKNDLDSAAYFFDEARRLSIANGHHEKYLWSLYYRCNVWVEAGTPWLAREVAGALNDEQQASIYANLCWHYTFKPGEFAYDLDTAVMYGRKSLAIARRLQLAPVIEHTANALITALMEGDKLGEAVQMLAHIPEPLHYKALHRIGYGYHARREKSAANLDSAEYYTRESLRLAAKFRAHDLDDRNYYVLANTGLLRNRPFQAKTYLPHLTGIMKGDICQWLARWHVHSNRQPDSARIYGQMALREYEAAKQHDNVRKLKELLTAIDRLVATQRMFVETIPGSQRFRKLLDMARQYQSGFPAFDPNQLSIAINYLHSAILVADSLNIDSLQMEGWKEMAKTQCMIGNVTAARRYVDLMLARYRQRANVRMQAHTWAHFGSSIRRQRPNYNEIAQAYLLASRLFGQVGDKVNELNFGMEAANYFQEDAQPEEAGTLLLELSRKFAHTEAPAAYKIYRHLALLARKRGDLGAALRHAMTGLRLAEQKNDKPITTELLTRLAEIYHDLGQHENSIQTYRQVIANSHGTGYDYDYYAVLALTQLLIDHRSAAEALAFVKQVEKDDPPTSYYPRRLMEGSLALCYDALGQTGEAETHFKRSIDNVDNVHVGDKLYSQLQFNVGKFYLRQRKYTEAAVHLRKAIRFRPDIASVSLTNNAHYLLFQCDSALGNYRDAIGHFQLYKYYNDSLFNVARIRQISELQIQYETEKKDQSLLLQAQEIRLREQDILLLTRQSLLAESKLKQADLEKRQSIHAARQDIQLKEKNIAILTKNAQIQQGLLEKERLMRNVTFGGASLLLVIIGLLINGYRLKQRHNQSLQDKQVEIGQKNRSLEKLLTEKEWLLKEIHHRVKNNLQIVMSLLNSQSEFLQNDAALVAIRDSQHRVQAISLIHKKLYQSDNVGLIFMPHYIHELVDYLIDCFDAGRKIRFHIQVAPIQLDVSQAVPIGLILNEAITNAIKYAFPGDKEGLITLLFGQGADGRYALTVADDGQGLPADFDPGQSRSLGMSLMEGLSVDLGGHFSIGNQPGGGAAIRVWFEEEHFIRPEIPTLHTAHN